MKRFTYVIGLTGLLMSTAVFAGAQSVEGSAGTRTQGSARTEKAGISAGTNQESNVRARRSGNRAEIDADSNSETNGNAAIGGQALDLSSGTQLNAVLKSTLDSKKTEEGQQFLLKTTRDVKANGQTVIRKGSTLVGHVVNAQSRAEGEGRSEMTVMIDGVQQGGQIVPLQAVFVGMVQQTAQSTLDSDPGSSMPAMTAPRPSSGGGGGLLGGGGGGGLLGGVTGTVSSTVAATGQTLGSVTGPGVGGTLSNTVNSTVSTTGSVAGGGTINQPGQVLFSLSNGLTAATSGSLSGATEFSRAGKDLKLEKGTEFVLAVTGSSRTSAGAQN